MALCYTDNLSFNLDKTKEIHFKRSCTPTARLLSVSGKEFQALHIREPSSACTSPPVLPSLYKGNTENTVTSCLSVWYGSCWVSDQKPLKRGVKKKNQNFSLFVLSSSCFLKRLLEQGHQHRQRLHPALSWSVYPFAFWQTVPQPTVQGCQAHRALSHGASVYSEIHPLHYMRHTYLKPTHTHKHTHGLDWILLYLQVTFLLFVLTCPYSWCNN